MPAGKESDNPAQRTTFRPPWVKEGPKPATSSNAPWTLNKINRRDSSTSSDNSSIDTNPLAEVQLRKVKQKDSLEDFEELPKKNNPLAEVQLKSVVKPSKERAPDEEGGRKNKILANVQLRKTSIQTKEPQENGAKESFFQKPALKHVPQKEKSPPKKDHKIHNLPTLQKVSERVLKSPPRKPSYAESYSSEEEEDEDEDDVEIDKEVPKKRNALVREASMRKLSQSNIPMPPPQPGMPPPPPMMMGDVPMKPLTSKQKGRLDKLRSRPKQRPDWNNLLQEIESKKKLKHVVCNDRSSPLLPEAKTEDEHLIYKSEEPNVHNELLKQIEGGIKLKKVKTNDRSKPMLDGLRKIRRQMTIEEQIQKSISMASIPAAQEEIATDEIDEMDDIDKVRDDLQSTKQMLALELRNKEAQERENKRLLARILNLEAELEKERSKNQEKGSSGGASDEKVTQSLRKEVEEARKMSTDLEKKYHHAAEELDTAKMQVDELKRQNQMLERRLQEANLGKRMSVSDRKHSTAKDDSEEEFAEETEEESDGEDTPEKQEKRALKEVKKLAGKLQSFKNKEDNAKKERIALKDIIKKHQIAIKEEKKKYKQLKKEVDKMAALMKDVDEEEDEDAEEKEDAEEEEAEEEESTDEEEESESESEDDSESEVSQSEDEDAPVENKKTNLSSRVKRHENRLNALKKGNFLLKTNAERLQDDLNKQKDMTASLQEDLDSVLSELG